MVFLDGKVLSDAVAVDPTLVDLSVAHEFGHAGGLVHRSTRGNLMYPSAVIGESPLCQCRVRQRQLEM